MSRLEPALGRSSQTGRGPGPVEDVPQHIIWGDLEGNSSSHGGTSDQSGISASDLSEDGWRKKVDLSQPVGVDGPAEAPAPGGAGPSNRGLLAGIQFRTQSEGNSSASRGPQSDGGSSGPEEWKPNPLQLDAAALGRSGRSSLLQDFDGFGGWGSIIGGAARHAGTSPSPVQPMQPDVFGARGVLPVNVAPAPDPTPATNSVIDAESPSVMASVGSAGHAEGTCKPCAFAHTKVGCQNGAACEFCHLTHNRKNKPRPCKGKRDRYRKLIAQMERMLDADGQADGQAAGEQSEPSSGNPPV